MTDLAGAAPDPAGVVTRLAAAMNGHDLEALVACFAAEYRNETPAPPSRSFVGQEQVRENWTQILGAISGLTARIVRHATVGDTAWIEWDWTGTGPGGAPFGMRGVTIFGIAADRIASARFYMEPVDPDAITVDEAVRRTVGAA